MIPALASSAPLPYCHSRYATVRRRTIEALVGSVGIGAAHLVRVQSMTTTNTQDVEATVRQSIALAEVGCEIVRVTAPNHAAARALRDIRQKLTAAGFGHIPLVADIHFLPSAAMEAVEHVEKVRVNPGNYADKKKFAVTEYSDAEYERELQRIYEAFTPLVLRARELGRALRIGTNHGSLSDRIMNRYGDTPLGMVESALEFLRICESHGFRNIVLSMKASNPKVMIQAYRLLVARMDQENMHYPLHLGVTEAGDGEDGRIKSAIGIGSLLHDGLGDTIRVSLTEDSVYEIPVAQKLAAKAHALWRTGGTPVDAEGRMQKGECRGKPSSASSSSISPDRDSIDPYHYARRDIRPLELTPGLLLGTDQPPRVFTCEAGGGGGRLALADTPIEGNIIPIPDSAALQSGTGSLPVPVASPSAAVAPLILDFAPSITVADLDAGRWTSDVGHSGLPPPSLLVRSFTSSPEDIETLRRFAAFAYAHSHTLVLATTAGSLPSLASTLREFPEDQRLIFTLDSSAARPSFPLHAYRALAEALRSLAPPPAARAPIWIRNTPATALPVAIENRKSKIENPSDFLSRLLDAAILTGALLCDGIGDIVSIETLPGDPVRATKLAYNILQGAGARVTKTEYVACPSCGRTLFDLQTTTQRIREKTGHLKGVKLAIMGCIVNGPGEMADADFGYVGGAPGRINLYVGKTCVQYNIPQAEADARLIALIKEHGKWQEPQG